jgi:Bax protein
VAPEGGPPAGDVPATIDSLLARVDEIPVDLALAQAAWESAWGVSKLAREDHGLFGQSVAVVGEGVSARPGPNGVWYARFRGIRDAVEAYVRNLNTYGAYEEFRRIRREMRKKGAPLDAVRLAGGLHLYSELGEEYVGKVREVIRSPNIAAYSRIRLTHADSGILAGVARKDGAALALGSVFEIPDA